MAKKNDFDLNQQVYFIRQVATDEDTVEWAKNAGKVIGIRHTLKPDGSEVSKYKLQVPPVKPEEELWVEPANIYLQEAAATKRAAELNAEKILEEARDKVEALKSTLKVTEEMKICAERSMEAAKEALEKAEKELAALTKKDAPVQKASAEEEASVSHDEDVIR